MSQSGQKEKTELETKTRNQRRKEQRKKSNFFRPDGSRLLLHFRRNLGGHLYFELGSFYPRHEEHVKYLKMSKYFG
jgi:hypothetical protein